MKKLELREFKTIIEHTPLVSIDLIIENSNGEILLGWRKNAPAKGFWFVPGGRIVKDEPFAEAFKRIAKGELGIEKTVEESNFLGVYEHLYPNDNFLSDPQFSTHYIVNAFRIKVPDDIQELPVDQHEEYWWASIDELLADDNVHENTKNYFNGKPSFAE